MREIVVQAAKPARIFYVKNELIKCGIEHLLNGL